MIVDALLLLPLVLVSKIEKLKILAFIGVQSIMVFIIAMTVNFVIEINERNWQCSPDMAPFGTDLV